VITKRNRSRSQSPQSSINHGDTETLSASGRRHAAKRRERTKTDPVDESPVIVRDSSTESVSVGPAACCAGRCRRPDRRSHSAGSALSAFNFFPCFCVSVVFVSSLSLWFSCRLCVSVIFVSSWPTSSRLAHRTLLDPLFVPLSLQDVLHENSRRDDVIRIDRAGLDEALD